MRLITASFLLLFLNINLFCIELNKLKSELDEVIKQSSEYMNSLSDIAKSESNLSKEYVSYYPLTGTVSTDIYGDETDPFNLSVSMGLNYNLFHFDAKKNIENKKNHITLSELRSKVVYENRQYRLVNLISNYIGLKRLYQLTIDDYETISEYTDKVNLQFNSGALSKSALDYAESILLKNQAILLESNEAVLSSLDLYFKESKSHLDESIDSIIFDINIDSEILDIIGSDLIIKQLKVNIDDSKNSIELTKSNTLPNINLSTTFSYPFSSIVNWRVGADLKIPIFSRKYDIITKEELQREVDNTNKKLDKAIDDKRNSLNSVLRKIDFINKKIVIYQKALGLAKDSLEGILIESVAGVSTVFDVINSQQNISNIKKDIIKSENQLLSAKLEFHYLVGGFIEK